MTNHLRYLVLKSYGISLIYLFNKICVNYSVCRFASSYSTSVHRYSYYTFFIGYTKQQNLRKAVLVLQMGEHVVDKVEI